MGTALVLLFIAKEKQNPNKIQIPFSPHGVQMYSITQDN